MQHPPVARFNGNKTWALAALTAITLLGCDGGSDADPTDQPSASDTPFPGFNLIARLRSTQTQLVDLEGLVVHSWTSSFEPGASAYLLADGSLLRTANTQDENFNVGGAGGRVERVSAQGELLWSFDYSDGQRRLHHDIAPMPNGNILMLAWELIDADTALEAGRDPALIDQEQGLWPDLIIEVEPDSSSTGGHIVWEWRAWDHLVQDFDPAKPNFDVVSERPERINLNVSLTSNFDWLHSNSIDYNAERDEILLSVHGFDEIWVIDHSTTTAEAAGSTGGRSGRGGDLLYRWGNPQSYGRGDEEDKQLFGQHDAEWIGEGHPRTGNILVFNNGRSRPEGTFSSVEELVPPRTPDGAYVRPATEAFGPQAPIWQYRSDPPQDFNAPFLSSSQRLANGNTLINEGTTGRLFEVNSNGEIVWSQTFGELLFRVDRYSLDHLGIRALGL